MNFLIAQISESYTNTLNRFQEIWYKQKITLMLEKELFDKTGNMIQKMRNCCQKEKTEEDYEAFIITVKQVEHEHDNKDY